MELALRCVVDALKVIDLFFVLVQNIRLTVITVIVGVDDVNFVEPKSRLKRMLLICLIA